MHTNETYSSNKLGLYMLHYKHANEPFILSIIKQG